jgi:hypothetical protein
VVRKEVQRMVRDLLILVRPPTLCSYSPSSLLMYPFPLAYCHHSLLHGPSPPLLGKTLTLIPGAIPTVDDFGIMGIVLVTIIAISTGVVVDGI